jgi:uncharacterized protein
MDINVSSALQALGGGVLIGAASWLLLVSLGRVAGVSGIAATALFSAATTKGAERISDNAWRWAFLFGLVCGGALFALWLAPPVIATRPLTVLIPAGLLVGFGTVIGSGCTSGHGVCGLGRRSVRSLAATIIFMGFGFATIAIIHAITGRSII